MKKFFFLFTIVLLLLITLLVLFRLQITSFVVIQALKRAGLTDIVFIPTAVNGHALVVSRFSCTLPGLGSHLAGNDLRITWDRSILHSKQINTIAINTLGLGLTQGASQSPPIPLQQRFVAIMQNLQKVRPSSLASLLPFHKLHVKNLYITGNNAGLMHDRELSLELEKKKNRGNKQNITARISLPREQLQLQASTTDFSTMVVQLGKIGRPAPLARAEFFFHDREITTRLKADLADLSLVTPILTTNLPKMKGQLSCTLTLSGREKPHANAELRLIGFKLAGIGFETGTLRLHGEPEPGQGIIIGGEAIIQNTTLKRAGAKIDKLHVILHKGQLASQQKWRAEISATANNLSAPQFHCDSITLPRISVVSSVDRTIIMQVKAQQPFVSTGVKGNGYAFPQLRLLANQDSTITIVVDRDFSWSITPGSWQIASDAIGRESLVLTPAPLTLKIQELKRSGNIWYLQATITCPKIYLQAGKTGLTITEISLALLGDNTRISGNGAWKLNHLAGLFTLRLTHNLKTGKGDAVIATTEPVLFSQDRPLSAAVTGWALPGDLTNGKLRVKSFLRWPPLRMTARISLNNGQGFFKDIHFSGLSISQNLELLPVLQTRSSGPVTIATVDAGIPIRNLATKIGLKPSGKPLPIIILKNSHASLLGGKVSNDYIHIDPQRPTLRTIIHVHDIHLADLLALQQVKGLKVTGSVSGELPIRLDKEGFHVDSGRLHNEPAGGIIEYTPPGDNGLRDSPLTGYALKALEEFHYNLLAASAKYSPDGNLEVTLHLEGKSPKLDTNRPVHLNITTQQNLLSLIKSLRYSDSLTNEIDREVQQHFQKKQANEPVK